VGKGEPMIESYSFGRMKVSGVTYTSDLIVFDDHVKSDWWRSEGHRLHVEDLAEVLEAKPEILIVGTGCYGSMKIPPETERRLEAEGVRLIAEETGKAAKTYNELARSNRAVGAFHLTC
jgi:hypothetical protein